MLTLMHHNTNGLPHPFPTLEALLAEPFPRTPQDMMQLEQRLAHGLGRLSDDDYVFPHFPGEPWRPDALSAAFFLSLSGAESGAAFFSAGAESCFVGCSPVLFQFSRCADDQVC